MQEKEAIETFHRRCSILPAVVTSIENDASASDSNACVRQQTAEVWPFQKSCL